MKPRHRSAWRVQQIAAGCGGGPARLSAPPPPAGPVQPLTRGLGSRPLLSPLLPHCCFYCHLAAAAAEHGSGRSHPSRMPPPHTPQLHAATCQQHRSFGARQPPWLTGPLLISSGGRRGGAAAPRGRGPVAEEWGVEPNNGRPGVHETEGEERISKAQNAKQNTKVSLSRCALTAWAVAKAARSGSWDGSLRWSLIHRRNRRCSRGAAGGRAPTRRLESLPACSHGSPLTTRTPPRRG